MPSAITQHTPPMEVEAVMVVVLLGVMLPELNGVHSVFGPSHRFAPGLVVLVAFHGSLLTINSTCIHTQSFVFRNVYFIFFFFISSTIHPWIRIGSGVAQIPYHSRIYSGNVTHETAV